MGKRFIEVYIVTPSANKRSLVFRMPFGPTDDESKLHLITDPVNRLMKQRCEEAGITDIDTHWTAMVVEEVA